MKVGILTYHRSHNYGALLQAMALRKSLEKLGHEVKYVDYWPEYHKDMYRILSKKALSSTPLSRKIKNVISVGLRLVPIMKRRRKFQSFISKHVDPYCAPVTESFDCIVCGSDQIWRKQDGLLGQFNPVYFGAGETKAAQYVSYAASMGIINLDETDKNNLKKWLSKFTQLSVRETDLKNELDAIGLRNVREVIDPTLLMDKEEWLRAIPIPKLSSKPYLVLYELLEGSFNMDAVERFAKDNNLEIKKLRGGAMNYFPKRGDYHTAGPEEMLSLIANASYVFTSSFHGLVFSIIHNKPFYASFVKNSGRAESLLSMINQSERLLPPNISNIPDIKAIDYKMVNRILSEKRKESIDFLAAIHK